MGKENTGRKISRTVGHQKKLSDITNTPILLKSRIHDENAQFADKNAVAQLQQELISVKKLLDEKEAILAESKRCMEKLWCSYCRKSKQNDEIILRYQELSRDLTQARDQLKILQHEYTQMSAVYKACKAEMQEKLNGALEQIKQLTKVLEVSSIKQVSGKHCPASTLPGHSLCDRGPENGDTILSKSSSRKKQRQSYKKPSLKAEVSQVEGSSFHKDELNQNRNCPIESELGDSKLMEAATAVFLSPSCKLGAAMVENAESHKRKWQQCVAEAPNVSRCKSMPAAKVQNLEKPKTLPTAFELSSRPQRRAASSIGSYKEPTLKSKMRRAD